MKIKTLTTSILILLIMTCTLSAATFTGVVISTDDNNPIYRATIRIGDADQGVFTDEEGAFEITSDGSELEITISHIG